MNLLLIAFLLAFPSKSTTAPQPQRTVIEGQLEYVPAESGNSISLRVEDDRVLFGGSQIITTQADGGHFKFEIFIESIRSLTLIVDSQTIKGNDSVGATGHIVLVEPGDSLYLSIPARTSQYCKDIIFSGRGSEKQHLIETTNRVFSKAIAENNGASRLDQSIAYKQIIEQHLNLHRHMVTEDVFRHIRSRFLQPGHVSILDYFQGQDLTDDHVRTMYRETVQKYFPLRDLLLSDEGEIGYSPDFENRAVLDYLAANKLPFSREYQHNPVLRFSILNEAFAAAPFKSRVLAAYIIREAKLRGWSADLDTISLQYFKENDPSDKYRKQLAPFIENLKQNLLVGAKAFDFALPDTSGTIRSLREFRGNVVLIDFMFNGCGACKAITPRLQALEHRFKDEKVSFISISIDPTMAKFRKGIGKFCSASSLPLYTGGEGLAHPIITHYGIQAFPTLVLIDKTGNIINARAPDPRTEAREVELISLIEEALRR